MRVALLWTDLSGYMDACFRTLARRGGVELFVANRRPARDAPFDESLFAWMENRLQWQDEVEAGSLIRRLEQFRPEVILCSNWHYRGYRHAMRRFKGRAVRIFTSDRPWMGNSRQWMGVLASRFYLRPLCEAIFVAGERQVAWARKMGFRQERIFQGLLTCDHEKFAAVGRARQETAEARAFVYVGRFTECKGLDVLASAYRQYRMATDAPWPLRCYGTGRLRNLLEGIEGLEIRGFCQPGELPEELGQASCLILPSSYDGWGIVVHEAAAAGMAVIVSDAVGASAHLVRHGHSGYIVSAGDAEELAQAMLRYSALDEDKRREMGENSYRLSLQFTPEHWADTLLSRSAELKAHLGGGGHCQYLESHPESSDS